MHDCISSHCCVYPVSIRHLYERDVKELSSFHPSYVPTYPRLSWNWKQNFSLLRNYILRTIQPWYLCVAKLPLTNITTGKTNPILSGYGWRTRQDGFEIKLCITLTLRSPDRGTRKTVMRCSVTLGTVWNIYYYRVLKSIWPPRHFPIESYCSCKL